jgi:uncharacterized repeat protein (TIGR01451 family)
VPIAAIVAMLGLAGHAFADPGNPVKPTVPAPNPVKRFAPTEDTGPGADMAPLAPSSALAAAPANDTCAGAIPLELNQVLAGTTVGAIDDYHSPNDTTCFAGNGEYPTAATGRDVVYSFTAPATGKYTFRSVTRDVTSASYGPAQNIALYLTDCASAGGPDPKTVNCLKGGNAMYNQTGVGSLGQNSLLGEAVSCYPMTNGQTAFLVFDDGPAGRCNDNNHRCKDDSYCHPGATCVPQINAGGTIAIEVIPCEEEVEPNDTPATASAISCGVTGATSTAPNAHCYLGDRNGNACRRSYASVSYLDQTNEDSNMRCLGSGAMCILDPALGTDDCAVGTGPCQQQTDTDCDPRCDIGPNAGKSCSTHAFCNPVSDQGATCAGACVIENTCIDIATGADTGVACTFTCQGSSNPAINGRVCSSAANFNACPGGGTCTVTALVPALGATCVAGQTCGRVYNEGDTDYYSVGSPVAGSKVFASVWANNANDYDYRMRVTTDANTLQFDDNDAVSFFGGTVSAVIGGAVADGTPTYIQVGRTQVRATNTYQIYSIVRPPLAAAQLEDESGPFGNNLTFYWPGDVIVANPVSADGYIKGSMDFALDSDCFRFLANKGDLLDWVGDGNPARAAGSVASISSVFPIVYYADPAGANGITNYVFGTDTKRNNAPDVQGPGLRALTPAVISSYVQWRSGYTGMMEVCWYDLRGIYPTSGAQSYPAPWAGSMATNCGPTKAAGPGTTTADVSITKTGPAGPVTTGSIVDYTITITNDSDEIAQSVELYDALDPNLTFTGLTVDDTLGGANTGCFSLPTPGANDFPIDCINASMAPHTVTVYTLSVQVNNCIGSDVTITNQADIIYTESTDPDPNNNSSGPISFLTVAQANNGCSDLLCDLVSCISDLCTSNDVCNAGVCTAGEPTNCDDNSLCTDDSCDPAVGCINDSSLAGDLCDDFVECTTNTCDPVLFCVFPPKAAGTSCDDGLTCTLTDQCDGTGICGGSSVCDDNDPCTDDVADEGNACACTHPPSAAGTACDDASACTTQDACDGSGVCVGSQPLACDDNDACTTDSCDPATGCIHTAVTCNDGNACNGTETCDAVTGCVAGTPLACNDGNACNGVETCAPATGCVAGTPVVCAASDQCHDVGTCNPGTGLCSNPASPNGTACDDADACTTNEACNAGACAGGVAVTCADDGDVCTANVCDPASGCVANDANFDTGGFSASRVDGRDLVVLADAWNSCASDPVPNRYDPAADLDPVSTPPGVCVDLDDFHLFMNAFGRSCP